MYDYNLAIRFQQVASQQAERIALWLNPGHEVTYTALNQLANRIARLLLDRGAKKADVVCISGEKSSQTFATMLACLKIGCTYAILDPDSPVERLRKILSTCRPKLLIAEIEFSSRLAELTAELEIAVVNDLAVETYESSNLSETRDVTGSDAAYIMFTSGSTGFPKAAVMTHANVLNLIAWAEETFSITTDDVLTNVNPLYFDNSVFDFYSSLFNGARLAPFTKAEVNDPGVLVQKIDAAQCTLWFSVPSLLMFLQTMKAADGKHLSSIRRFIFGGEGYPKTKLKALYDAYSARSELFNVYGPTECTCICSSYKISAGDFTDVQGLPPLGHIAKNFSFLIVDDDNREVPVDEIGELCLLGPNVGKGYYNDPARTAAAFVQNPRNAAFTEIMYKTGDLVRFNSADGKLYIYGRKDNQIKHMGYRIELEEIESALHCLDDVSEAVVLHSNANGRSKLIAIVAGKEYGKEFDGNELRSRLKQIIPAYMIPSVFHREDMLPKSPNGKVDRRYLAEKYLENQHG